MKKYIIRSTLILILGFITLKIRAESLFTNYFLEYQTEVQYNFKDKFNWVNLWTLGTDVNIYKNGYLSIGTLSVYKTSDDRIADDLQTFSNIEEDNMPLSFYILGYTHKFRNAQLFFGIRNINLDYFIGDYTSFFTNSSCGIHPTLAENYTVANYPESAMALHLDIRFTENLLLKNSLYNGRARQLSDNGISFFKIAPRRDGFMNLTELSYQTNNYSYGLYSIGIGLCNRYFSYYDDGQEINKKINYTLWGNIEKELFSFGNSTLGILMEGSFAGKKNSYCKSFIGGGVFMNINGKTNIGAFIDHAVFSHANETAMEFTCSYPLTDFLEIKPTLHHIITGSKNYTIGLIRFILNIN